MPPEEYEEAESNIKELFDLNYYMNYLYFVVVVVVFSQSNYFSFFIAF